ncbi:MAG: hypothetical protein AAF404_16945, partial [Pseudomonadota bacterium]
VGIKHLYPKRIFTTESRPANKWLQLDDIDFSDYSHVIINDTDKVYISFDPRWANDSIRACKFVPRPTYAVFESLFAHFNLGSARFFLDQPDPRDKLRDPRNYVNNHNGGMIIIPTNIVATVTDQWKHYIDELGRNTQLLGPCVRNLDQIAFALAMESLGIDINFLPKSLDIGLGVRNLSSHVIADDSGQFILHVHADEDANSTIVCRDTTNEKIQDIVAQFNNEYHEWLLKLELHGYCYNQKIAA